MMMQRIYRLSALQVETSLSRSTIYSRIAQGLWTKPVSLGGRAVGWPSAEIEKLTAARIAGRSDQEIRELVTRLLADRSMADL